MGSTVLETLKKLLLPYKPINLDKLKEEQLICVSFVSWLRQKTIEQNLPFIWFHIPNDYPFKSLKTIYYDLKQKHMGKISGAPDYCFIGKNGSFFIEVKSKKGKQSENQKLFEKWCLHNQIDYYVCRSFESCVDVVINKLKTMS